MSEAALSGANGDPAGEIDPAKLAMGRRAVAGKLAYAAFGEIISVLMRSPAYRHYTLADLEWLVAPAVLNRQFSLVQIQTEGSASAAPAGLVMWATLSEHIEQQLLGQLGAPLRLSAKERKSGQRPWITDAVGDKRIISVAVQNLRQKVFQGQSPRTVVRGDDGALRVVEL